MGEEMNQRIITKNRADPQIEFSHKINYKAIPTAWELKSTISTF